MNSLFSKCYTKNFSNILKLAQKRNFSSTSANPLANLSCSYVVNAEVNIFLLILLYNLG